MYFQEKVNAIHEISKLCKRKMFGKFNTPLTFCENTGSHCGTFWAMASMAWPAAILVSQLLLLRNTCTYSKQKIPKKVEQITDCLNCKNQTISPIHQSCSKRLWIELWNWAQFLTDAFSFFFKFSKSLCKILRWTASYTKFIQLKHISMDGL